LCVRSLAPPGHVPGVPAPPATTPSPGENSGFNFGNVGGDLDELFEDDYTYQFTDLRKSKAATVSFPASKEISEKGLAEAQKLERRDFGVGVRPMSGNSGSVYWLRWLQC